MWLVLDPLRLRSLRGRPRYESDRTLDGTISRWALEHGGKRGGEQLEIEDIVNYCDWSLALNVRRTGMIAAAAVFGELFNFSCHPELEPRARWMIPFMRTSRSRSRGCSTPVLPSNGDVVP